MTALELIKAIDAGQYDAPLTKLYGAAALDYQRSRYTETISDFENLFGDKECFVFSAPGRSEISGNHTDHNHGKVIAAGINLDIIAVVAKTDNNAVSVKSKGFESVDVIDIDKLGEIKKGVSCSRSLIAGMLDKLSSDGYNIGGFEAYTTSDVIRGSGLSSSAAFEVIIGTILSYLYNNGELDPVYIAKASQYAENVFFGKPCGLMDQTACSVGGFIEIDFRDPVNPMVKKLDFDFSSCGYALCVVDTGGSHANLTDDYAAIPAEMKSIAKFFDKEVLREVDEEEFTYAISEMHGNISDRAILRAMHFFAENKRVTAQSNALKAGDFDTFLKILSESGRSSYMYNQNVFTCKAPAEQGVSLALAVTEKILDGKGAFRVHGGGFAGTIQAFVPREVLDDYKNGIEKVFGEGSCKVLSIRNEGGIRVI